MIKEEIIQHAGVKGMRWGTRLKSARGTRGERKYGRALKAVNTINTTGPNAPSKRAKARAYKKVAKYRNMLESNTLTNVQTRGNLEGNISRLATTSGSSNYRKNVKKMLDATSTGIGKEGIGKDGNYKKIRKAAMAASVLMSDPEIQKEETLLHYGVRGTSAMKKMLREAAAERANTRRSSLTTSDSIIQHAGIKGMHWGTKKGKAITKQANKQYNETKNSFVGRGKKVQKLGGIGAALGNKYVNSTLHPIATTISAGKTIIKHPVMSVTSPLTTHKMISNDLNVKQNAKVAKSKKSAEHLINLWRESNV